MTATGRRRKRATATAAVVVLVAIALLLSRCQRDEIPDVVHAVAVGSMVCAPTDPAFGDGAGVDGACDQKRVSDMAVGLQPDLLLGLGDYQYEEPKADAFRTAYDPTWGRLRSVTRPALGNQEYKVHDANTFFDYFGDRAGPRDGWYSYDAGRWHVVVLNSNCDIAGGCGADSPQAAWLRANLAAHDDTRCTLAYWHHPRFSDGLHGADRRTATLWQILDDHNAELVLSAHEHDYQRFGPLDAEGRRTRADEGISSFVVGTGGQATYAPDETTGQSASRRQQAKSDVRVDDTAGVLALDLRPDGWDWKFLAADGTTRDYGTGSCR